MTPRRRLLGVLITAQVLAGLGGSGAAALALLAADLTGSAALASLPLALLVAGSAAAVVPISALSLRAGRRKGLAAALGLAAVGAAGVVAGGGLGSFALVCAASLPFGAGNAALMLARYAAVDLSPSEARGRAIGLVVFATTFGAVAGPNLLAPSAEVAGALGLPALTGLPLLAAGAFALAAAVLVVGLRPDPLELAVDHEPTTVEHAPLRELVGQSAATIGLVTVVVVNFVMVAVMAMAPVEMEEHGQGLSLVGLVISLHIAGMFAPAPVAGWLTDRLGPLPVTAASALLLSAAGLLSAVAGGEAAPFAAGLVLLGVGWCFGLIAGSALLASSAPASERPRLEGAGELSMGVAAGTATALAGPIVGLAGYGVLALTATVAAASLGPLLLTLARRHPCTNATASISTRAPIRRPATPTATLAGGASPNVSARARLKSG